MSLKNALQDFHHTHDGTRLTDRLHRLASAQRGGSVLIVGHVSPLLRTLMDKDPKGVVRKVALSQYNEKYNENASSKNREKTAEAGKKITDSSCTIMSLKPGAAFPIHPPMLFDTIIFVHSLKDSAQAFCVLPEAWRLLKPKGRLLVTCPTARIRTKIPQLYSNENVTTLHTWLENQGFQVFSTHGVGFLNDTHPWIGDGLESAVDSFRVAHKRSLFTITQARKLSLIRRAFPRNKGPGQRSFVLSPQTASEIAVVSSAIVEVPRKTST